MVLLYVYVAYMSVLLFIIPLDIINVKGELYFIFRRGNTNNKQKVKVEECIKGAFKNNVA